MRIWAFPAFYPLDHPGMKWAGIFAHRQYKGLIENGAEVKVIQPVLWHPPAPLHNLDKNWKKLSEIPYPQSRTYDGIEVFHPRISNMKPSRFFSKRYEERYVDAILSFFEKNNIALDPKNDVFYSQWIPLGRLVQIAAHKLGVKSALLTIGDDVLVWPHEKKENVGNFNKAWVEADYRISVAAYLAEEANTVSGEKLPYFVVRRGVEHSQFKPVTSEEKLKLKAEFRLPANKRTILTVGSSLVRKGWLDLFDALATVKKTNSDIVLVGVHSGPVDINLDEEAAKRGITDIFMNLGEVAPQQINKLYNAADIFCLASHWEGIANSVVEAMSCGLPVLTTNVCGHPELITSGNNGILVSPKQPGELARQLSLLIDNQQKREELGANARNFIVNEWGSFAQNSAKLYKILSS